jgi:hypothetical protein
MKLPNLLKRKRIEQDESERRTYFADMISIGVGNAGIKLLDKICSIDSENSPNEIYPIGIRTSLLDCQSPRNIGEDQIIFIGEEKERRLVKGTGGNQSLAQELFLQKKEGILEKISELTTENTLFLLLGSLAGGTGGGGIPVLSRLLKKNFPDNPVLVAGILPDRHEGLLFQANASRSLLFLEEHDALILFENRAIRSAAIEEGFDLLNNEFARSLYLFFATSAEEYALNSQQILNLIKRIGGEAVCLTYRHVTEEIESEEPKTDEERETLKSDMIRLLMLNLSHYPGDILGSARGGAYYIGSSRSFFLHDLMGLLSTTFEDLLGGNGAHVVPGFWKSQDYSLEIVTMLVGVDPSKYEAVRRVSEKWKVIYGESEIEECNRKILNI